MHFNFQSSTHAIGTTEPLLISQFHPRDLSTIVIKSGGTVYIGFGGVSASSGFPLLLGESLSLTCQDFPPEMLKSNFPVRIYAIAAADTTISVLELRK